MINKLRVAMAVITGLGAVFGLVAFANAAYNWTGTSPNDYSAFYALNDPAGSHSAQDSSNNNTAVEPSIGCTYNTDPNTDCTRSSNPDSALSRNTASLDFDKIAPDTFNPNGVTFSGTSTDGAHFNGHARITAPQTRELIPYNLDYKTMSWGFDVRLEKIYADPAGQPLGEYQCGDVYTGTLDANGNKQWRLWQTRAQRGVSPTDPSECTDVEDKGYDFLTHQYDSKVNLMQMGLTGGSLYKAEINTGQLADGTSVYGVPTCTAAGLGANGNFIPNVVVKANVSVEHGIPTWDSVRCELTLSTLSIYVNNILSNSKSSGIRTIVPYNGADLTIGAKDAPHLAIDQHDSLNGSLRNVWVKTGTSPYAEFQGLTSTKTYTDVNSDGIVSVGDLVGWNYAVGNTDKGYVNVTINGTNCNNAQGPFHGGTLNCVTPVHTITSADTTAGQYCFAPTGIAYGNEGQATYNGNAVIAPVAYIINGIEPDNHADCILVGMKKALTVFRSEPTLTDTNTNGTIGDAGDVISYNYTLTNTSTERGVHNVIVTDNYTNGSPATVSSCATTLAKSPLSGYTVTCTENHTITAAEVSAGAVSSTASMSANVNSTGEYITSNSVTSSKTVPLPANKKLMVIVEENHNRDATFSGMPYLQSLASTYGEDTSYTAGPQLPTPLKSLESYLLLSGGSTAGYDDDHPPATRPVYGGNVFTNAVNHGKTAHVYADEQTTNCQLVDGPDSGSGGDSYLVRHTGAPYYVDTAQRNWCLANQTDTSSLASDVTNGNLANVSWLIPAKDHDAHFPYSLAQADTYLQSVLPSIIAGPDFQSGLLTIVITTDEGSNNALPLPFVVVNKNVSNFTVASTHVHYDLYDAQLRYGGTTGITNDALTPFGQ